ncbi:MAG: type II CAAX endopeptidase family protein [Bryobacterales bacterium]|nr:CPBP family intramembrane metalloprotease [Bryobacteraceae bacterium]MDW8354009.1 type II CAAX endopeptidase family protein [Bryobacterales bacterium]
MPTPLRLAFLCVVAGLFSRRVQSRLQAWVGGGPRRVWTVPVGLASLLWLTLWLADAWGFSIAVVAAAHLLVPAAVVVANRRRSAALDFCAILILWLPIEFAGAARALLPAEAQGLIYEMAEAAAVVLALFLFLIYRHLSGMKYNLPGTLGDFVNPLLGFLAAASILIPLGRALCFLGPFGLPEAFSPVHFVGTFAVILAGVALPEELLFRSLIQNRLMQCWGESNRTLLVAALIFGAAHLNNGPQPLPNWRYMILATIAGFLYGKVFQRSSSVMSSALLHALVNTVRRIFFL